MQRFLLPALGTLCLSSLATAQVEYATSVISANTGAGGPGIFDETLILGGPRGGDGIHVYSLGTGGDVTLGFDVTITNGPGSDFVVFENGFEFDGLVFPEMAMVEVSTNGVDFARFPMRYDGPQGPFGSFELLPWGIYSGLTGLVPPVANVDSNTIDPRNVTMGGGEGFDLDDLLEHPLVVSGLVDLDAINQIRLVDLVAGEEVDFRLVTIWDSGGVESSADIDSIAVIHHTGNQNGSAPTVDLYRDDLDYVFLEISDPDGFLDVPQALIEVSVNLERIPFTRLRDFFVLVSANPNGIVLRTPLPVILENFQSVLAVTAYDQTGLFSVDQISLNR